MNNKIKITLFIAALALISCKKIDASKGTTEDRTVDLSTFNKIEFNIPGNLEFTQENETSIVVNSNEKIFNALKLSVSNNTLYIEKKKGYHFKNSEDINFKVSSPNIEAISVPGSGKVDASFDTTQFIPDFDLTISGSGYFESNALKAVNQEIVISGSGNIDINYLENDNLKTTISGSGLVDVRGLSVHSDIAVSGSGSFRGFNYITDDADIKISGSGLAEVHADSTLDAEISGSGSVFYKGNPIINYSSSGSGSLNNSN